MSVEKKLRRAGPDVEGYRIFARGLTFMPRLPWWREEGAQRIALTVLAGCLMLICYQNWGPRIVPAAPSVAQAASTKELPRLEKVGPNDLVDQGKPRRNWEYFQDDVAEAERTRAPVVRLLSPSPSWIALPVLQSVRARVYVPKSWSASENKSYLLWVGAGERPYLLKGRPLSLTERVYFSQGQVSFWAGEAALSLGELLDESATPTSPWLVAEKPATCTVNGVSYAATKIGPFPIQLQLTGPDGMVAAKYEGLYLFKVGVE